MISVNYNFIFLLYLSRSGSTYFTKVLVEDCDSITILPETNYFRTILSHFKIFKKFDARCLSGLILEDPKFKAFNVSKENLINTLATCNNHREAIYVVTSLLLEKRNGLDTKNILIKDGGLVDFAEEINLLFADPKIIFIQRDPRGGINSLLHSPKIFVKGVSSMGWNDIEMCCNSYESYLKKISIQLKTIPYHKVTFESLIRNEKAIIEKTLVYLKLDAGSEKVEVDQSWLLGQETEAHKNVFEPADKDRIYAWKRELEDWEIKYIEFRLHNFIPLQTLINNRSNLTLARCRAKGNHFIGATRLNIYRGRRYFLGGNFNLLFLKLKLKLAS